MEAEANDAHVNVCLGSRSTCDKTYEDAWKMICMYYQHFKMTVYEVALVIPILIMMCYLLVVMLLLLPICILTRIGQILTIFGLFKADLLPK